MSGLLHHLLIIILPHLVPVVLAWPMGFLSAVIRDWSSYSIRRSTLLARRRRSKVMWKIRRKHEERIAKIDGNILCHQKRVMFFKAYSGAINAERRLRTLSVDLKMRRLA